MYYIISGLVILFSGGNNYFKLIKRKFIEIRNHDNYAIFSPFFLVIKDAINT